MAKFKGKLFIEGDIILQTGLHIGGSKETGEIGGLDNPVIKTVKGVPYIPGSSLKGKIRCLLERTENIESKKNGEPCSCGKCNICLLFGSHSSDKKTLSRLIIRDSYLDEEHFMAEFGDFLEGEYTEEKTENIIDRITGTAQHPRTMERVPAGAKFKFSSSISFYDGDDINELVKTFIEGIRMLEDDYLGGSGTRGYGQIRFENMAFYAKNIESYSKDNKKDEIETYKNLNDVNIDNIVNKLKEKLEMNQR
ncbi:MAG: type III-A CRISPR-associated RAMP protein Csm3 [Dictyoglomus sp. NZ13-RE01]|nr:MAG: type III-A CRISPR-associated RAMP protein Csm3 [Dictyoglomus sp. NZ13-RE01]